MLSDGMRRRFLEIIETYGGRRPAPAERVSLPARTHIEALEDCDLLVGRYEDLRALYRRHPGWQAAGRLIAEQHFIAKERREYEFLQQSASERYLAFRNERPDLAGRLAQYQVASYLGITPVALSRIVRRLGLGAKSVRPRRRPPSCA
jgi:CRP-like cAMP-binding protein